MYDIIELNENTLGQLRDIAEELNIPKYESLKKQDLIYKILDFQAINPSKAPDILMKNKKTSSDEKKATSSKSSKIAKEDFTNDNGTPEVAPPAEQLLRTEHSYHESEEFSLPVDPVVSPSDTMTEQKDQPQQTSELN